MPAILLSTSCLFSLEWAKGCGVTQCLDLKSAHCVDHDSASSLVRRLLTAQENRCFLSWHVPWLWATSSKTTFVRLATEHDWRNLGDPPVTYPSFPDEYLNHSPFRIEHVGSTWERGEIGTMLRGRVPKKWDVAVRASRGCSSSWDRNEEEPTNCHWTV